MKQNLIHHSCHTPISYSAYTPSHNSLFQWTSLSQICLGDDTALLVQIWEKLDYFLSQCLLYIEGTQNTLLIKSIIFKVILVGTGVQLKLRKHPNAYNAIKWNLNLLVITFLTTLTSLARVVLRNDASPSDEDNERLVCVRRDQCHDHIKDIRKRVD